MSAFTTEEKKRLAEKFEEVALECVTGEAPEFGRYMFFHSHTTEPVCAVAHVVTRAGLAGMGIIDRIRTAVTPLDDQHTDGDLLTVTTDANNQDTREAQHAALPWALLALRDALLEAP